MTSISMMDEVIQNLDEAYLWLCRQRRHYPANADIWHLRFHWPRERETIVQALLAGHYHFSPMQTINKASGESVVLWNAPDALVLKAITLTLARYLPVDPACTHVKDHGGAKRTVTDIDQALQAHAFVLRTDVKNFYASIDHHLLHTQLARYINDPVMLNLIWQSCDRLTDMKGYLHHHKKGIPRGCPLSPLLGAFFLYELDRKMVSLGLFYCRYMDDIIVLAPSRWKLRKAVKRLNTCLSGNKLTKHPDKTFIGRVQKGFDFLGYQFGKSNLCVSKRSLENYHRRYARLYEQKKHRQDVSVFLESYRRRWMKWVCSGVSSSMLDWETVLSQLESCPATTLKPKTQ